MIPKETKHHLHYGKVRGNVYGRHTALNTSCSEVNITTICLYNFDPLKPQFYIIKHGFTGVYIISLFLLKNIDRGGSNEYPQSMFWAEIWKNIRVFIWKFSVFGGEIFYIFE